MENYSSNNTFYDLEKSNSFLKFLSDYKSNNLFLSDYDSKALYNYKLKLTPHYFDFKCRVDSQFNLISKTQKKGFCSAYYKKFIIKKYIQCILLYNKRNYNPFKTWFDYWFLGFKKKSVKVRSKYSVARTRQTLFDLCSCNFQKGHALFLTLSYDINKKLDSTIYDINGAYDYDQALIDIKRFIQRFKRTFGEAMQYCYFVEKQTGKHNNYRTKTDAFHFHILIFNAMYFKQGLKNKDCKENAQKLWGHGMAFVEKIPQVNINNTCKYISKYVSKDTLAVESGDHALHTSRGLKRPIERVFYNVPTPIDNCISLELSSNLGMLSNGFIIEDLCPFIYDNNKIIGNPLNTFKTNKLFIKSRYIEIVIMRLPSFDDDKPVMNNNCDFLVKIHCDLDYRKNFFKKRCF